MYPGCDIERRCVHGNQWGGNCKYCDGRNNPKTIEVHVFRTRMIGGGTSYDVLIPIKYTDYRPISGSTYATVIHWGDERYYRIHDYLRTPSLDRLPALSDARLDAFRKLHSEAGALEFKFLKKAFSETRKLSTFPSLWVQEWTLESKVVILTVGNIR